MRSGSFPWPLSSCSFLPSSPAPGPTDGGSDGLGLEDGGAGGIGAFGSGSSGSGSEPASVDMDVSSPEALPELEPSLGWFRRTSFGRSSEDATNRSAFITNEARTGHCWRTPFANHASSRLLSSNRIASRLKVSQEQNSAAVLIFAAVSRLQTSLENAGPAAKSAEAKPAAQIKRNLKLITRASHLAPPIAEHKTTTFRRPGHISCAFARICTLSGAVSATLMA